METFVAKLELLIEYWNEVVSYSEEFIAPHLRWIEHAQSIIALRGEVSKISGEEVDTLLARGEKILFNNSS